MVTRTLVPGGVIVIRRVRSEGLVMVCSSIATITSPF
jgi:hypothetical protein